jgi:DNA-binding transcriptional LysR family regulator
MKQNFTVRQGALDGVEAVLGVARHRSFRKAAAELAVTPSAISQAVRALEARIGAALFMRTTRSVGLTEAGERFLSRAKPAFEELIAASAAARDLGQRPAGLLRLTMPPAVVPILLEPLIASFCEAYPEVEVEIVATEELIDLAAKGFDAGVRMGQFIAADMIAVRLTPPFRFIVVGSPDYLRRHKRPERVDDLRQHACLRMRRANRSIAPWSFIDGNKTVEAIVSGPLIANDFPTMLGAAIEGMGLAQVPEPIAAGPVKAGKLVQVLKPFAPTAPGVFLYFPSRHQMMPKLRAFVDHVKNRSKRTNKS